MRHACGEAGDLLAAAVVALVDPAVLRPPAHGSRRRRLTLPVDHRWRSAGRPAGARSTAAGRLRLGGAVRERARAVLPECPQPVVDGQLPRVDRLVRHRRHGRRERATTRSASSPSTTARGCGSTAAWSLATPAPICRSRCALPLSAGRHRLVVRADWRDPHRMRDEGWFRTWFNFGGLNREVTIRRLGASELDAPGVDTRLRRRRGRRDGHRAGAQPPAPRTLRVRGTLGGAPLRFPRRPARRGPRGVGHARACRSRAPACGRPAAGTLYDAAARGAGRARLPARVGLRELRRAGDRLLPERAPAASCRARRSRRTRPAAATR